MEELIRILKEHTYHEPTKLKNIAQSDFYVDVKEACGYPNKLNIIVDELYKLLSPETTCVAGNGYGGSFVPVLASRHNLNFCMIRDQPKNHGRNKGRIEHYFPKAADKVAVFDDVLSTGGSLKETGDIISTETEAEVIGYCVVVKRGELTVTLSAPLKYLVSVEEILR